MKYIDADKLIAEIERLYEIAREASYNGEIEGEMTAYDKILSFITSLQQEQPVHSHYTKVRETKTGRVFWAEYSSEAAEWYEAGTGKAYSSSKVEIVKEQPEVDLDALVNEAFDKYSSVDGYGQLSVSFNRAELYSFIKNIARKEE